MNTEPFKKHLVFTTFDNTTPQILTLNDNVNFENAQQFFDIFCESEEIVSAVLFGKSGEFMATYNGD